VLVAVHDADGAPVAGASVSGTWAGVPSGEGSCTTDGEGRCALTRSVSTGQESVTLTVDSVSHEAFDYQAADNADPDGDSDGTTIAVYRP
jgi:hypothetical protein